MPPQVQESDPEAATDLAYRKVYLLARQQEK
jgi:hypothetical protein